MRRQAPLFLACLAASGCFHLSPDAKLPASSEFKAKSFESEQPETDKYPDPPPAYRIAYVDPARQAVAPPGWHVLSHETKRGVPKREVRRHNQRFVTWDDGKTVDQYRTQAFDLELSHDASSGKISALLEPLTPGESIKQIHILAEQWVNGWNGTVATGSMYLLVVRANRVATRILESTPAQVGSAAAHTVTFEMADLDQLELDPKAPRLRGRLVVVEPKMRKRLTKVLGRGRMVVPARLVLLYVNEAGSFDAQLPVFEDLVRRVEL